jgi:hypothetical protein
VDAGGQLPVAPEWSCKSGNTHGLQRADEPVLDDAAELADKAASEGFVRHADRDLLLAEADPERLLDRLSEYSDPGIANRIRPQVR